VRKEFSARLHYEMGANEDIVVLTGDLGYGLWDRIKLDYPDRFFNFGSSEQLMVGAACGMAMEGKLPVVYSITPFLLYRPFEFIRNYVDHEKIAIKLVGGGRNKDYGYLGFSHWAEEDKAVMSIFKNIIVKHPNSIKEMEDCFVLINDKDTPLYINLKR
jgi:transketolase